MNRDYIDWLETLPCSRKRQPAWRVVLFCAGVGGLTLA